MYMKKLIKAIGKTGYPVSGNLRISGRISESGFSKPVYPCIRYPGSKSVSGTTLVLTAAYFSSDTGGWPSIVIFRGIKDLD